VVGQESVFPIFEVYPWLPARIAPLVLVESRTARTDADHTSIRCVYSRRGHEAQCGAAFVSDPPGGTWKSPSLVVTPPPAARLHRRRGGWPVHDGSLDCEAVIELALRLASELDAERPALPAAVIPFAKTSDRIQRTRKAREQADAGPIPVICRSAWLPVRLPLQHPPERSLHLPPRSQRVSGRRPQIDLQDEVGHPIP
jgi:hypothetical protein